MEDPVSTPDFWEACYHAGEDQWDLGQPTPLFERVAAELDPGRICLIGCGRGWDAITFAKAGFTVTAIDFAEPAVLAARREFFSGDFPCSTLVGVSTLVDPAFLVEIDADAIIGSGAG